MRKHVKIRKDYTLLVRAGKFEEAQALLETIWERKSIKPNTAKPVKIDEVVVVEKQKSEFEDLDSLTKIKGIGKKTVKDIKVMFKDLNELKDALNKDEVALRDDIVEKLKGVLQ